MKILLVSYGYSDVALSKHYVVMSESMSAYHLAQEIAKNHQVTIITKDSVLAPNVIQIPCSRIFEKIEERMTGRNAGDLKLDYVQYICRSYFKIKKLAKNFEIIHQISPKSFRYPSPMGNFGKPFIWGPIGGSIPYPQGFESIRKRESILQSLRIIDKYRLRADPFLVSTMNKAARILTTTNAAARILPERYRKKVVVVPQGIVLQRVEDLKHESQREMGNFIFSSGRLIPYKGMELAVKAFAQLRRDGDVKLVIAGDGPERPRLMSLIADLGLTEQVKLLGKVSNEENISLMRRALFCVFPALNEAFGQVNLEAMAVKKPIIVTDWGGPSDIVNEGITGLKIISDSVDGYIQKLKNKMQLLLDNEELRAEMGDNAYLRVKSLFTWEVIKKQIDQIYDEIINPAPAQAAREVIRTPVGGDKTLGDQSKTDGEHPPR